MRPALCLLFVGVLLAQTPAAPTPTLITITGPIYQIGTASLQPMSGTIDLTSRFTVGNLVKSTVRLQVNNGQFTGMPNLRIVPGQYTASYCTNKIGAQGCTADVLYWSVPDSGGPYTVDQIQSTVASTPPLSVILAQLPKPPDNQLWCITSLNKVVAWTSCPNTTGGNVFDAFVAVPTVDAAVSTSFDNATD